jgi:hypothetical protein
LKEIIEQDTNCRINTEIRNGRGWGKEISESWNNLNGLIWKFKRSSSIVLPKQPKSVTDVTVMLAPASAIVSPIRFSTDNRASVVLQQPSIINASSTPDQQVHAIVDGQPTHCHYQERHCWTDGIEWDTNVEEQAERTDQRQDDRDHRQIAFQWFRPKSNSFSGKWPANLVRLLEMFVKTTKRISEMETGMANGIAPWMIRRSSSSIARSL